MKRKSGFSRAFAIALCCVMLVAGLAMALPEGSASAAASGKYKGFGNTAENIAAKWQQLKPVETNIMYANAPTMSSPYSNPGSLNNTTLQNGVNMANFYRYIAGLGDVTLNSSYSTQCQAGAYVMAINGSLTHQPGQPAGMDSTVYNMGRSACGSSNIYMTSRRTQSSEIISDSVYLYMQDADSGNITRVGHRRWVLNQAMSQTGFGAVAGDRGTFAAMYAFDSEAAGTDPEYIAWPAAGYIPMETVSANCPWSISLDSSVYSVSSPVVVTMKAGHSGQTYTFNRNGSRDGEMYIDNSYIGSYRFTTIWRPTSRDTLAIGNEYDITISGLQSTDGSAMPDINYSVKIFSAESMSDSAPTPTPTATPTPTPSSVPTPTGTVNPTPSHSSTQNGKFTSNGITYFYYNGRLFTGWVKENNIWSYYGPEQASGWKAVGSKWYYFDGTGAMQTGWLQLGSKWYYLKGSGEMATGWQKVGSSWYYMNASGSMKTGWLNSGGWYYLKGSGAMATGWQKIGGVWYWFNSSGKMATGTVRIGTKTYRFASSGRWIS